MKKNRAYLNCTIINGDKTVPVIDNGTIIVDESGVIAQIGNSADVNVPKGMEVVDLKGKFVMPGLINGHMHSFNMGGPRNDMGGSKTKNLVKILSSWIGKVIISKWADNNMNTMLNSGVTTVREVGSMFYADLRIKELVNSGKVVGPRIVACGPLICTSGGHGCDFPTTHVCDGEKEMRRAVRKNFHMKVDWIKICNTGGVSDAKRIGEAGMVHMTPQEIEAVCDEAHRRGLMVASHCESTVGMYEALRAGVDTIEHGGAIPDDMVELFKNNPKTKRGYACLCPTLSAARALTSNSHLFEQSKENKIILENSAIVDAECEEGFKTAIQKGIKVFIGTDASVPFVTQYNTYKELVYFEDSGLSPLEVIDIATKQTAEIIDVASETGTLDKGKCADFIVLDENPLNGLKALKTPRHVVANGNLIKNPKVKRIKAIEELNY